MNLGFVILYVNDIDRMKAFYTNVLGLPVVEEFSGPTFVALQPTGGAFLALQDKAAKRVPHGQEKLNASVEVSFEADDVDEIWTDWKEKGVEMVTDPMDMPFGRYFMAKDPEGYYLSVYRFPQRNS